MVCLSDYGSYGKYNDNVYHYGKDDDVGVTWEAFFDNVYYDGQDGDVDVTWKAFWSLTVTASNWLGSIARMAVETIEIR